MKLTAQQVMDITPVVAAILRENRPLPLKGLFRLTRLHAKLLAEHNIVNPRHDALVTVYDTPALDADDQPIPGQFKVPDEHMAEYRAKWAEIAGEEVEIDAEPIPIALLDLGDSVASSITAPELILLGPLVSD